MITFNRAFFKDVQGRFAFSETGEEFVKLKEPLHHENFDQVNAIRTGDGANYFVGDDEIVFELGKVGKEKYVCC